MFRMAQMGFKKKRGIVSRAFFNMGENRGP